MLTPTTCSLEIISQTSQPVSSVFLLQKNQPAVLSVSQISLSEQAVGVSSVLESETGNSKGFLTK
jgi:hypothetical protein